MTISKEKLFMLAFVDKNYTTQQQIAYTLGMPLEKVAKKISNLRIKTVVDLGEDEKTLRVLPLK